jgi:hypothetical protein
MDAPTRRLIEAVAAWRSGYCGAEQIVDAATDLVVAGTESEAVAVVAGIPRRQADTDVPELLDAALAALDVSGADAVSDAIVTTAVLARRYLSGEITARALCATVHRRHGHDTHVLVEAFSNLDDRFDEVELLGRRTDDEIVPDVDAAAEGIVAACDRLLDGLPHDRL